MGSRHDAFTAGQMPKKRPTLVATVKPAITGHNGTVDGSTTMTRATVLIMSRNWVISDSALEMPKLLGVRRADVTAAAENLGDFIAGLVHLGWPRQNADKIVARLGIHFLKAVIRNEDRAIVIEAANTRLTSGVMMPASTTPAIPPAPIPATQPR